MYIFGRYKKKLQKIKIYKRTETTFEEKKFNKKFVFFKRKDFIFYIFKMYSMADIK